MASAASHGYTLYSPVELQGMKIAQLKQILESHKLVTTGVKATLISRLVHFYESNFPDYNSTVASPRTPTAPPAKPLEPTNPVSETVSQMENKTETLNLELKKLELELKILEAKRSLNRELTETKSQGASNSDFSSIDGYQNLSKAVLAAKLPVPEPPLFDGNPLEYFDWVKAFDQFIDSHSISDNDKLFYLKRYVTGQAKDAICGYFLLNSKSAYQDARDLLEERFGSPFIVTESFRDRLKDWPKIGPKDTQGLQKLTDFLTYCKAALSELPQLNILSDCRENRNILRILPDWLITRWNRVVIEHKYEHGGFPTFEKFVRFMEIETQIVCDPITSLNAIKNENKPVTNSTDVKQKTTAKPQHVTHNINAVRSPKPCAYCNQQGHFITTCKLFADLPHDSKKKHIWDNNICFGCLRIGHRSKQCTNRHQCRKCQKLHPTILHIDNEQVTETPIEASCKASNIKSCNNTSTMIVPVFVATEDNPLNEILVYALIDTQSDSTFVLQKTIDKLEALQTPVTLKITTMTESEKQIKCNKVNNLVIRGLQSNKKVKLPQAYSRDLIPVNKQHIPTLEKAKAWPHLVSVADKLSPLLDCDVGLLIGYNCPQAFAPRNYIVGKDLEPFAINTDLGWSIVGYGKEDITTNFVNNHTHICHKIDASCNNVDSIFHLKCTTKAKEILHSKDERICFEQEANHENTYDYMSQDDIRFLDLLKNGIYQDENGYYTMPLPLKGDFALPNNRTVAEFRFKCLQKKFRANPKYFDEYSAFMSGILERGEAEIINTQSSLTSNSVWYLPHHGVYHPHKPGKLRVVFDCSARFNSYSLNDCLLQGPDMTNNLVGVLCRFRKESIAIICDIEKMFHQFKVYPEQQDLLRFLWFDQHGKEQEYKMKVHLFGARSSPSCASFGLKQIAIDHEYINEKAANFIKHHFYVDDGLISVKTVQEATSLIKGARDICKKGNLRLHKFVSNVPNVLKSIPSSEVASYPVFDLSLDKCNIERALGIQWCLESDEFQFRVELNNFPITRRTMLSTVASIYDPLGLLAPVILVGKTILQTLCKENYGWDDLLPEELKQQWHKWCFELASLSKIAVSRCFKPNNFGTAIKYELHSFSDASTTGYGACTYLRQIDENNNIACSLVLGKARVAPLKFTTIPRLELQAAVLAAKLTSFLILQLQIPTLDCHFWTDSKIVLGYINNDTRRFHIYVANRIQQIKENSDTSAWHYVKSQSNPADHASRGINVSQLQNSNWFSGPSFLLENENFDVVKEVPQVPLNDPELKQVKITIQNTSVNYSSLLPHFERFSNWKKLVRGLAFILRTVRNKLGLENNLNTLQQHQNDATTLVLKAVQQHAFKDEIDVLTSDSATLKRNSPLFELDPFIDEKGLIRVGGRLRHSDTLNFEIKHPIVLPKTSSITLILVAHFHALVIHQGRGLTMNCIRSHGFWIIGCRSLVSSHIHKCVICRKTRAKPASQKMADLPKHRLEPSAPFTYCGMDCFGPFHVVDGRKHNKRYGLLLTCLACRAVHIEILDDMTTDCLINGLRCFIALRGSVRVIRADKGTNFLGAKNEFLKGLSEIKDNDIKEFLLKNNCDFVLNVPYASHMGGVWERQIKSVRNILTSVLSLSHKPLDSSSLRTFMYEIMAVINSRPLCVKNLSDPSSPEPLTPNHLLTTKTNIIAPPPGNFEYDGRYAIKRWRRVQFLVEQFWTRWRVEYLNNLQKRSKWQHVSPNLKIGDVVILHDNNLMRTEWKLGRVTQTIPSADGLVRKVQIQVGGTDPVTKKGKPSFLERPIHRLTLLTN